MACPTVQYSEYNNYCTTVSLHSAIYRVVIAAIKQLPGL